MSEKVFTGPDTTLKECIDVHLTDPDEGEWDIDVVVAHGKVEYVDLRIKPEFLSDFVDCLISDVGEQRASSILASIADRNGLDLLPDEPDA
jgi:hypothetical protein